MKDEFIYKLCVCYLPPDGQGYGFFRYILNDEQLSKVRKQIINGNDRISIITEDNLPISFPLSFPVLYATIEEVLKPKHIIMPGLEDKGIIPN